MLKALFRKQLSELGAGFIQNKKTNKRRSKGSAVGFIILYVFVCLSLCSIFFIMSAQLCSTLVTEKLNWLYFVLMGLTSIALGVFGSVFTTYSTLYLAKDNELLLSMPIPPSKILLVRLFGVWFWGTIFEAIVLVPAIIVYHITVKFSLISLLMQIVLLLAVSIFILTLSCALGWVVAKISLKLKNKSFITVIVSLVFLGAYMYFYSNAYALIQEFLVNAVTIGAKIKGKAYPIYLFGKGFCGDILSALIAVLAIALLFALVCYLLSRSFIKLATTKSSGTKATAKKTDTKVSSVNFALYKKELKRFTSSANYMLNCGLGILFLPILAVAALVKMNTVRTVITEMFAGYESLLPLLAIAAVCVCITMNDITAPSVSLEGKNIWLVQSLPISPWQVLRAKLLLHLSLTALPTFICSVVLGVVIKADFFGFMAIIVLPLIFTILMAAFGLVLNLKSPNLNWTNETVAVKQSMSVLISLFGGWLIIILFGALYFAVGRFISTELFIAAVSALCAITAYIMIWWLKSKGSKIFAAL